MVSIKKIAEEAKKRGFSKEEIIFELERKGYSRKKIEDAFDSRGKKIRREMPELNYFEKVQWLFSNPVGFFEHVKERTIVNSLVLFVVIAVIMSFIGLGLLFLIGGFIDGFVVRNNYLSWIIYFLVILGLEVGGSFVYAGISHLSVRGLGGEGDFVDSYNVCAYSLIPFLIILIVPYIGWLSIIYSVVLMTFGLAEHHGISKGKAVVAALMPLIIGIVLVVLFIGFLVLSIFRGGIGY